MIPILAAGGDFIVDHLTDPHHLATPFGTVDLQKSVNEPIESLIGIDPHISVFVLMMWTASVILVLTAVSARRWWTKTGGAEVAPSGIRNLFEPVLLYIRDHMVHPQLGPKTGTWTPFFWTLFFFILLTNLVGLFPAPWGVAATGNPNVTAALALMTLFAIIVGGSREKGALHFWTGLVPDGVPIYLWPLVWLIELFGLLAKHLALTIRLFANMTAGHVIILALYGFIFMSKSWLVAGISIGGVVAITLFEIFVSFVQAYIFTLLAAIFIGAGLAHEH